MAVCSPLSRWQCSAPGVPVFVTAVTVQAVIFGGLLFYQGIGRMVVAGATGLALGLTWLIAGRNLWAGIVLHALLDGSAMTAIYLAMSRPDSWRSDLASETLGF